MTKIDFVANRKKMHDAAVRNDMEALMKETKSLECEILQGLDHMINGFSDVQIVAIVAAMDHYKAIVMNVAESCGITKQEMQQAANELNAKLRLSYMVLKGDA